MRVQNFIIGISATVLLFTLSGCLELKHKLLLRADGSGEYHAEGIIPAATARLLEEQQAQAEEFSEEDEDFMEGQYEIMLGGKMPWLPISEKELKEKGTVPEQGVILREGSVKKNPDGGIKISYIIEFKDAAKFVTSRAGRGLRLEIIATDKDTVKLKAKSSQIPDNMTMFTMMEEETDPGALAQFRFIARGMKETLTLEVPGTITSTNAREHDGNTATWNWDIDRDDEKWLMLSPEVEIKASTVKFPLPVKTPLPESLQAFAELMDEEDFAFDSELDAEDDELPPAATLLPPDNSAESPSTGQTPAEKTEKKLTPSAGASNQLDLNFSPDWVSRERYVNFSTKNPGKVMHSQDQLQLAIKLECPEEIHPLSLSGLTLDEAKLDTGENIFLKKNSRSSNLNAENRQADNGKKIFKFDIDLSPPKKPAAKISRLSGYFDMRYSGNTMKVELKPLKDWVGKCAGKPELAAIGFELEAFSPEKKTLQYKLETKDPKLNLWQENPVREIRLYDANGEHIQNWQSGARGGAKSVTRNIRFSESADNAYAVVLINQDEKTVQIDFTLEDIPLSEQEAGKPRFPELELKTGDPAAFEIIPSSMRMNKMVYFNQHFRNKSFSLDLKVKCSEDACPLLWGGLEIDEALTDSGEALKPARNHSSEFQQIFHSNRSRGRYYFDLTAEFEIPEKPFDGVSTMSGKFLLCYANNSRKIRLAPLSEWVGRCGENEEIAASSFNLISVSDNEVVYEQASPNGMGTRPTLLRKVEIRGADGKHINIQRSEGSGRDGVMRQKLKFKSLPPNAEAWLIINEDIRQVELPFEIKDIYFPEPQTENAGLRERDGELPVVDENPGVGLSAGSQ